MPSLSGAGTSPAPSQPSELPCSGPLPCHLRVVWHDAAQDCGDEPVLGDISACASAVSVAVTVPKALWQQAGTSSLTPVGVRGGP